jgi:tRNA splicing endonuclease
VIIVNKNLFKFISLFFFLVLYKFGPNFNHANYCVSIENFWKINSCTWSFISGLNRACLNAAKTLLLVNVELPKIITNNIEEFLEHTKIKTIEINRWIPTQQESK